MSGGPDRVCSAKACRSSADWAVIWNNPRLHTPERRKVWLACGEHREHLSDFVDRRGFLIEVIAAAALTPADG